ncbi:MAG: hypothetical protein ABIO55_13835 [Ginsengibacter sp.]
MYKDSRRSKKDISQKRMSSFDEIVIRYGAISKNIGITFSN